MRVDSISAIMETTHIVQNSLTAQQVVEKNS